MAIGGTSVGSWDEAIPAAGESVGLGDDRIRSVKTTLRQAFDSEHVWASSGGTVGQHRAGSARAFYGLQSAVSASGTSDIADGRMMIASDTSRLFGVGSGGTVFLGGPAVLSVDTTANAAQRSRWAMETGVVSAGTYTFTVTFPNSGFSGAPYLQVSAYTQAIDISGVASPHIWKLNGVSASAFSGSLVDSENGVGVNTTGIQWMSVGTRAI